MAAMLATGASTGAGQSQEKTVRNPGIAIVSGP
jgi:hypothetical protein